MTATAKIGAVAAFWIAIGLVQTFNWGHGIASAIVLLLLLLAAPFAIAEADNDPSPLSPRLQRVITVTGVAFLALEIIYFGVRIRHPHLIDIATTTLAAIHALLHDANPYVARIDMGPETFGFTGYKYLPVMIGSYLPLGAVWGERGVLVTNLMLFLGCLFLMRRLAGSNLAPFLFLILPIVPEQIFAKGVTDLAAVFPLLVAIALLPRSSFLSGLCLGLSMAAKAVPGCLFLPALIPPARQGRYAAGIAVGLTPILPFLWSSPRSLIDNIVLFNMSRPADQTSWLFDMPQLVANVARGILIFLILAASFYVWRRSPSLAARCGIGAILTLGAILSGPGAHHNYQLWWLPFYAVTLSLALAPPDREACKGASLRHASAA